jgi:hypothetical protein
MRKRNLVLITIFFALLIAGTFVYAKYTNEYVWRDPALRYHCDYILRVSGLSGREAQGTTVIMVPIPASKGSKFFTPSAQNEPNFIQSFVYEIEHMPEKDRRGPYFRNMTEIFANKEIPAGKWVTFITETEKGPMLGFRTNETRLEDINFSVWFVADHFDIFDPINNESPLLFPVENISNISSISYGDHSIYASNPTFDSYVYLSNNLKSGENISFYITLCANNDPTKFPDKYFGEYQNLVLANTGDTGYVKVKAVLEQDIPFGSNGFFKGLARYARDFYDKQNSRSVNETYPQ